jgi:histidinol-phosphate aminotransferase
LSKMKWIRKRLKDEVKEEYKPSAGIASLVRKGVLEDEHMIRLDANENLVFPKPLLADVLKEVAEAVDVRTYPRLEENLLVTALGRYLEVPSDHIIVSNGSDPLIVSCIEAFLRNGEAAISISPTFSMYKILTKNQGFDYIEVPLTEDFSLDVDALLSKVRPSTVLCFLNSPNNPTGNQFKHEDVKRVVEEFKGFVVVDEAYAEFAPYSLLDMIDDFENLIVLRTFSKAFGLAGLRVGYSLANSEVSQALRRIQLPFNVNKFSLVFARKMLEKREIVEDVVKAVKSERGKLLKNLGRIAGISAYQSDANFVFFRTEKDAEKIFTGLKKRGVLIRRFTNLRGNERFLRVTVGLPEMNRRFLDALKEVCGE